MSTEVLILIFIPVLLATALLAAFFSRKAVINNFKKAGKTVEGMLVEAEKEAAARKKELLLEAKEEVHILKMDNEQEIRERKSEVNEREKLLLMREENFESRQTAVEKREKAIEDRENTLQKKNSELDTERVKIENLISQQTEKLEHIAGFTSNEAKEEIFKRTEEQISHELGSYVRQMELEAKENADKNARNILSLAIQRYAAEVTTERTVSVVNLPSDDMKGRLIGREGRNIRTIESLTGVDLIIDDTPEAVVLSCFDPVRRQVAKQTVEALVEDGRIHPGRIEELFEKASRDVNQMIKEAGEQAVFETVVGNMHPELVKLLGRLHFRTSYGQNVLKHSVEVAYLTGLMAGELGEDVTLARRAGLLHDIGKAVDYEVEGSHVTLGAEVAKKYKENAVVINAIESHHGDKEATSVIATLVAAADSLSAGRPGARSESIENYVKRLEALEEISTSFDGVEKSFAIQAGREIRVIVYPEQVDDVSAHLIAGKIKERIENELQYPGVIKVTVIREVRVSEVAK